MSENYMISLSALSVLACTQCISNMYGVCVDLGPCAPPFYRNIYDAIHIYN